jgi:hypothetical protein
MRGRNLPLFMLQAGGDWNPATVLPEGRARRNKHDDLSDGGLVEGKRPGLSGLTSQVNQNAVKNQEVPIYAVFRQIILTKFLQWNLSKPNI